MQVAAAAAAGSFRPPPLALPHPFLVPPLFSPPPPLPPHFAALPNQPPPPPQPTGSPLLASPPSSAPFQGSSPFAVNPHHRAAALASAAAAAAAASAGALPFQPLVMPPLQQQQGIKSFVQCVNVQLQSLFLLLPQSPTSTFSFSAPVNSLSPVQKPAAKDDNTEESEKIDGK